MSLPTAFTSTDAVDAWDAEFRWRDAARLRDLTIDDTWKRVADRAASAETSQRSLWSLHFMDNFSRWQLLPGEDILRALGTGRPVPTSIASCAVLNVAAFVDRQPLDQAQFDRERFASTAALAVRFLDDVEWVTKAQPRPRHLRIGVIGLADALRDLDLDYDGESGRQQGAIVARALAEGCLRGSVDLAEERGCSVSSEACRSRVDLLRARCTPEWLIERMLRFGMRHDALTAIDSHPALARLANGVSDAIDPLPASVRRDECGHAHAAELQMRAGIQPWIDEPIAYARS